MDLGVGQAGVVVDTHEDDLPADAAAASTAIAMDRVADPSDAAEVSTRQPSS